MAIIIDPAPLERRRIEKGLTQTDVAKALNISPMTVHRVEAGESRSPKVLKLIADYLRVKMGKVIR